MGELFCFKCVPRWIWAVGILAFLSTAVFAAWRFRLAQVEKSQKIGITFYAYDTQGRQVKGAALVSPYPRQPLFDTNVNKPCKKEEPQNTAKTVTFELNGRQIQEDVVWRPKAEFLSWLKSGLFDTLRKRDPGFNEAEWRKIAAEFSGRAGEAGNDYPVVFPTKK